MLCDRRKCRRKSPIWVDPEYGFNIRKAVATISLDGQSLLLRFDLGNMKLETSATSIFHFPVSVTLVTSSGHGEPEGRVVQTWETIGSNIELNPDFHTMGVVKMDLPDRTIDDYRDFTGNNICLDWRKPSSKAYPGGRIVGMCHGYLPSVNTFDTWCIFCIKELHSMLRNIKIRIGACLLVTIMLVVVFAYIRRSTSPTMDSVTEETTEASEVTGSTQDRDHSPAYPLTEEKQAGDDGTTDKFLPDFIATEAIDIDEGISKLNDYFPIHEDSIEQMLSEIKVENSELASPEQLKTLRSVLKKNILAYKHGNAEAILADRLRAPYEIRSKAKKSHLRTLKQYYTRSGEKLPSDPEKIMRLLVDRYYNGEGGSGYKNLYNELSVEGSHMEIHESSELPMSISDHMWLLFDTNARSFKNGVATLTPSVEYLDSAQKVLQTRGKLLYIDVSFAASDSEGKRYSRLKRYYWSMENATWLPMEIVSLLQTKRKADEFF